MHQIIKPMILTSAAAVIVSMLAAADAPKPAPQLDTAKFWRLTVRAQTAHQQAERADREVQQEVAALAAQCGQGFILGVQQDRTANNFEDLACVPKPAAPEPAPEPAPKAEGKK